MVQTSETSSHPAFPQTLLTVKPFLPLEPLTLPRNSWKHLTKVSAGLTCPVAALPQGLCGPQRHREADISCQNSGCGRESGGQPLTLKPQP